MSTYKVEKTDAEWREQLSPMDYQVTRQAATERPFSGRYWDHFEKGDYRCVCCGVKLFESDTKFDAGCGWPSYWQPADDSMVERVRDTSHGMIRTEVRSVHGDSHLGHVFPDGPQDRGGLRYCINSASLRFIHRDDMEEEGYGGYLNQVEGK